MSTTRVTYFATAHEEVEVSKAGAALHFREPDMPETLSIFAPINRTDAQDFLRRLAAAASELADDLTIGGAA